MLIWPSDLHTQSIWQHFGQAILIFEEEMLPNCGNLQFLQTTTLFHVKKEQARMTEHLAGNGRVGGTQRWMYCCSKKREFIMWGQLSKTGQTSVCVLNGSLTRSIMTNLTSSIDPSLCLHFSAFLFQHFPILHWFLFLLLFSCPSCILSASITHTTCSVLVSKPFSSSCSLMRIFKRLPHLTSSPSPCLTSPVILPSPNHLPGSLSPLYPSPLGSLPNRHPPKPLCSY